VCSHLVAVVLSLRFLFSQLSAISFYPDLRTSNKVSGRPSFIPHRGNSLPRIAEAELNELDFKEHPSHTTHPSGVSFKSTRRPQEARKRSLNLRLPIQPDYLVCALRETWVSLINCSQVRLPTPRPQLAQRKPYLPASLTNLSTTELELYRLEQKYARRKNRTTFNTGAQYVDGEYVYSGTDSVVASPSSPTTKTGNRTWSPPRGGWR
jgi:hypothetical protein